MAITTTTIHHYQSPTHTSFKQYIIYYHWNLESSLSCLCKGIGAIIIGNGASVRRKSTVKVLD